VLASLAALGVGTVPVVLLVVCLAEALFAAIKSTLGGWPVGGAGLRVTLAGILAVRMALVGGCSCCLLLQSLQLHPRTNRRGLEHCAHFPSTGLAFFGARDVFVFGSVGANSVCGVLKVLGMVSMRCVGTSSSEYHRAQR
jgi:hypothetical protein